MVRIRCESGVRIKILESGFLNPDPHAFAISLVWFADPDHVRIQNQLDLHFDEFFMDPDPRIWIRVRVSPNSFRKNFNMIFWKKLGSAPTFWWICSGFFYNLALKMRYAVWEMKRGSGPKSRSTRPPSHRHRSKARYRTATDYGPGICIRVRIPYRTVGGCILILLWRIKIELLGDRIRVQYSDLDLPGLIRVIRASHLQDARCPRWRGQSGTRFKDKNLIKIKVLPPQVHREPGSANCGSGTRIRIRG